MPTPYRTSLLVALALWSGAPVRGALDEPPGDAPVPAEGPEPK